jgi:hypothetical protein
MHGAIHYPSSQIKAMHLFDLLLARMFPLSAELRRW